MMTYNPADWYWIVADDDTRAFSSKSLAYALEFPADRVTRIDTESNLRDVLIAAGVFVGFVSLAQARRELRTLNVFAQIDTAANANPESGVYDAWNFGNGVTRGQALATFIQTTLGWDDAQMDDFMTSASEIRL